MIHYNGGGKECQYGVNTVQLCPNDAVLSRGLGGLPSESACLPGGTSPMRGGPEACASAGLSTAHISPQSNANEGKATFCLSASYVKVSKPLGAWPKHGGGGRRGVIGRFSRGSRRRLLRKLSQVQRGKIPVFITLTYPGEYDQSPDIWKRHLDKLGKRIRRRFKSVGIFWKLEPQKRGAPHFHLLVWGASYWELKAWTARAWYEVVNSGDERHLRAGTRVEKIRSWRGVFWYASKYMGKEVEALPGWEAVGRYWGVIGESSIPWGSLVEVAITYPEAIGLIRLMRRSIGVRGRNYASLTGIVNADFWFDRLDRLLSSSFPVCRRSHPIAPKA